MRTSSRADGPLDPAVDSDDDDGTRAGRANEVIYGRVIDVSPPDKWAALREWDRRTPLATQLLLIFYPGFVLL